MLVLPLLIGAIASACSGTGTTAAPPITSPLVPATVPAVRSTGCGHDLDVARIQTSRPGDVALHLNSGGVTRGYRMGIPLDYDHDTAVPLVVDLHGSGSDALQAGAYNDLPRLAAARGIVVVTPDALGGNWQLSPNGTDADFLRALVGDVESRTCVDEARVYLVGMSLGAWKAAAQACSEGPRYAAIALVAVEVFPGDCPRIPVLAFHGTADPVVAYGAGGGTVDAAATPNKGITGTQTNIATWASHNGCDAAPVRRNVGTDVVRQSYRSCKDGADVELYTILGGGHTWPGSDIVIGAASLTTHTISATELALDWFHDHPRRPDR